MFFSASIKEAFQNGSGDWCFQKEGKFVFLSRHMMTEEFLKELEQEKGFVHVPHDQVLKINEEQNPKPNIVTTYLKHSVKPSQPNKFAFREDPEVRGYMDEFPDSLTCGGL